MSSRLHRTVAWLVCDMHACLYICVRNMYTHAIACIYIIRYIINYNYTYIYIYIMHTQAGLEWFGFDWIAEDQISLDQIADRTIWR